MKRILSLILAAAAFFTPALAAETLSGDAISITAPHAILMEKESGFVIYEKDADKRVAPASVTKVMTILLITEDIAAGRLSLEDTVTASKRACSMGGSQIYLAEGESMSVRDMLKSIVVSSANDSAVAMAEHLSGTEEAFAARMNERAAALGLQNTHFTNCTGLFDDSDHFTSARDVAIMSRELILHDMIKDYTTIWMDTVRDGEFGLRNTNKLVRRYEGCTGLKTGFTSLAGHCLSATAKRGDTEYIAVVMGASTGDERFESAATLLNYAFANYTLARLAPAEAIPPVRVTVGERGSLQPEIGGEKNILLKKAEASALEYEISLPEAVEAPISEGQELGTVRVTMGGRELKVLPLIAPEAIGRRLPTDIFMDLVSSLYGRR